MAASEHVLLNPTNGPLRIGGGRYMLAVQAAAWNAGNVQPVFVLPNGEDGTTFQDRRGGTTTLIFTANGFATVDLPPCQIDYAFSGATGTLMSVTRMQCGEPRSSIAERVDLSDRQPHIVRGGLYMFAMVGDFTNATLGLGGLLLDGSGYAILNEIGGHPINGSPGSGHLASSNLVALAPGLSVKMITTGTLANAFCTLTSIPAS